MQRDSPTVPGYDVGQFPPVPLFVLPDLSLLDASTSGFTIDVRDDFGAIPGVTVSSARCEDGGRVSSGSGTAYLYGDGSGNFTGPDGTIQNYGDGTGLVNGIEIEVEPIGPVPELGVFPPLSALQPITSCGTLIKFQDGVLFDFARSDVRSDAARTLETVAQVLSTYEIEAATVSGHTDAIGSDDENQTLSEQRAASVVAALEKAGVPSDLTAEGYGESLPVAANEIDGRDNPAGRQLNRRVEIFIPATF